MKKENPNVESTSATILYSYFEKLGFIESEIKLIVSFFKVKDFKKGDYFVKENEISLQLGFIESGQFQYFSMTEQGEERTTYISLPNTF
jgi:CRP/FNR family transcriptional regulator, anaerobic regulatory protein